MPKCHEIFTMFNKTRALATTAEQLELPEIQAVLNYVSDRLIVEYHRHAEDPVEEVKCLTWDEDKWPSATAILMEMKSMILQMKETEDSEEAREKNVSQAAN